jgi:hypothetical protein
MKILKILAVCVGVVICQLCVAQDTNKVTGALSKARRAAMEVKHIPLTINYGLGHVLMSEQPTLYSVQLPIGGGSSFEKYPTPDVGSLGLQVWLLRTDGTAIPQHGKPDQVGIGNAGWDNLYMIYTFDKGASSELAGIVVRAKGKLYCQEIGAERK